MPNRYCRASPRWTTPAIRRQVCALRSIRHELETASCQVTEDRDLRIQARTRDVRRHMVAAAAGIFYPAATYLFVVGAQKRSGNISHGLLVLANSEALFFGKVTATAVIPYRNRSGERRPLPDRG